MTRCTSENKDDALNAAFFVLLWFCISSRRWNHATCIFHVVGRSVLSRRWDIAQKRRRELSNTLMTGQLHTKKAVDCFKTTRSSLKQIELTSVRPLLFAALGKKSLFFQPRALQSATHVLLCVVLRPNRSTRAPAHQK